MTTALVPLAGPETSGMDRQADTDAEVVRLWLHGKSPHTQRGYSADVRRFQAFTGAPLAQVKLRDLQAFSDSLAGLADGSKGRCLAAVKSLFSFSQRIGYLRFNVAAAIQLPHVRDTLAERILPESDVLAMIHQTAKPRDKMLLRLGYSAGLRVSELVSLKWKDAQASTDGAGQISVFGKGGKTRVIRLTVSIWTALQQLRGDAAPDAPIFRSQLGGGHLDPSQARRIVYKASQRAGLTAHVSPHWLRHAHASHAMDRGAPLHLVSATLGHASVATTGRYLHARPGESSSKYLAA